ncbi:hypothetical protein [Streptomyces sp. NBC_01235]|uniref:hypothetical protein n=1 Tax=Streptomyces sp. NBC_01235 TaxID=2903788 RepID=UPI002E10C146|nr:hypothetical protein OG289_46920 [Streptomyces sp. NBC_01235]
MTDDAVGPEPKQVSRVGPFDALFLYVTASGLCLCGPVMLGLGVVAGAGLLLAGILFTPLCTPLGIALRAHIDVEREDNRRLDAVGVVATAEVTSLTDWADGESTGFVVGLRIGGPGCGAFETTWKRSRHPALRVSLRLAAVVDRDRRLFRVEL